MNVLVNLLLAVLYFHFANSHLLLYTQTHNWSLLLPTIQETLLCTMFLIRCKSHDTSFFAMDWIVGIAGTFLPLMIRANVPMSAIAGPGHILQVAGFFIAITALLCLNRSIGIVPANRGVTTFGIYRVVRHPMYLGHLLCLLGYVLLWPSVRNCAIVLTTAGALSLRIAAEESWLRSDAEYRRYRQVVRWKLVPWVC